MTNPKIKTIVTFFFLLVFGFPFSGNGYLKKFPPFPSWWPVPYPSPLFKEIPVVAGEGSYDLFEFKIYFPDKKISLDDAMRKLMKSTEEVPEEKKVEDGAKEFPMIEVYHSKRLLIRFNEERKYPMPDPIRIADLDGNGYPDLVISAEPADVDVPEDVKKEPVEEDDESDQLAAESARVLEERETDVMIFLQTKSGSFSKISYTTLFYGPNDFIEVNGGGQYEVIMTSVARLSCIDRVTRTFIVYNLYSFEGPQLVISNRLLTGFPKFIWYTRKKSLTENEWITFWDKDRYVNNLPRIIPAAPVKTFKSSGSDKESG